ncbi:hypothetical protein KAR91_81775 [Candidatus Pacearchaeota archaeon]|nr:hypothetical protein [Candidatus Pacearchaeota archaeon]
MPRLKKNDVRLTMDRHGFLRLEIPKQGDEENVPDYVYFLTVIGILIKTEDARFKKYVSRRGNEIFKDALIEMEDTDG